MSEWHPATMPERCVGEAKRRHGSLTEGLNFHLIEDRNAFIRSFEASV